MKKITSVLFYFAIPIITLAQAVDDGHGHVHGEVTTTTPADPEQRVYVMIGVGIIFVLLVAWFVWSKKKSS